MEVPHLTMEKSESSLVPSLSTHYTVTDMSDGIIRGENAPDLMTAFHDSKLTLEHLTHWRHPDLSLNIFQLAIIYQRADLVKSLGSVCPFFYTDRSMYKLSLLPCFTDRQHTDDGDGSQEMPDPGLSLNASSTGRGEMDVSSPQNESAKSLSTASASSLSSDLQVVDKDEDSEDDTVLLNSPLHLACMVGSVDCAKYLLENTCSSYLNQIGFVSVVKNESETNPYDMFHALAWSEYRKGKPFEFCVSSGHIGCVFYFLNNIIIQCLALRFLYAGVREPSSMLHKACSIGCGPLVELLLKNSFRDVISLSDKNDKTPLHVAVWNGDTDTIQHLLDSGASVNAVTESKGCLHILYRSKLHPYNYVANTKLLIKYGINVHITDKNDKSALHILAEEIGISRIDVMRYWKKASDAITEMTSSQDHQHDSYCMETYQADLVTCLELLLKKGMNPNKVTSKNAFSETVLEVLLQYSSLPYTQTTLWNSPNLVYRAVELLLSHNANPNIPSRCADMPLFTYFIMNHLNDIKEDTMKCKFIHLFCLYGADVDCPSMSCCYPVVAAVEKQTAPMAVELLINLMDIGHFHQAAMTIQERLLPSLLYSGKPKEIDFGDTIVDLFQKLRMRSLRHFCKVAILKQLLCPVNEVNELPLPKYLKDYITSDMF